MTDLKLDMQRQPVQASLNPEAAMLFMRVESWHQSQCDQAQVIFSIPDGTSIQLQSGKDDDDPITIEDKREVAIFQAGANAVYQLFHKIPFELSQDD